MICSIEDIPVYYEEYGEGKPVLCIHGYGIDHRAMSGCLEPVFAQSTGYRRIYLDLPGMGKTPSAKWVQTSENMLEVIIAFIDQVIAGENFLIAGQSYGGFLTLNLIKKMPERIDGTFLWCPLVTHKCFKDNKLLPKHRVLFKSEDLPSPEEDPDFDGFLDYAVIATPEAFGKYKNDVLPGVNAADNEFLYSGVFKGSVPKLDNLYKTIKFDKLACIITGRQDHTVGYLCAYELLERFPRATFAVLDCAGHNLPIDNEPVFNQLVKDWLLRVELESR